MGRAGRSLRETWRDALQNADRVTDGDLSHLLADQPPEVIAQAVADFQRQRERADKRLVMEHTVADAAAHLSSAVAEPPRNRSTGCETTPTSPRRPLGQKQLAAGASQGELLAGIAQLLAYQGAREAAMRYEDEIALRNGRLSGRGRCSGRKPTLRPTAPPLAPVVRPTATGCSSRSIRRAITKRHANRSFPTRHAAGRSTAGLQALSRSGAGGHYK